MFKATLHPPTKQCQSTAILLSGAPARAQLVVLGPKHTGHLRILPKAASHQGGHYWCYTTLCACSSEALETHGDNEEQYLAMTILGSAASNTKRLAEALSYNQQPRHIPMCSHAHRGQGFHSADTHYNNGGRAYTVADM